MKKMFLLICTYTCLFYMGMTFCGKRFNGKNGAVISQQGINKKSDGRCQYYPGLFSQFNQLNQRCNWSDFHDKQKCKNLIKDIKDLWGSVVAEACKIDQDSPFGEDFNYMEKDIFLGLGSSVIVMVQRHGIKAISKWAGISQDDLIEEMKDYNNQVQVKSLRDW